MTTETTTRKTGKNGRNRRAVLLGLAVGAALAGMVALAGTAREAEAAVTEKIVFASNRTTGTDVNNPTGDYEIFRMNPDGTGVRQLTSNKVDDFGPVLSPDKTKVAYHSHGVQTSNPEGDYEIYVMNASDGRGKKNLSNNGVEVAGAYPVDDYSPVFSPGGKRIAYTSSGIQDSNPEGDFEIYVMNALDGTGKKNLSNNGVEVAGAYPVDDYGPVFSPSGDKIAYSNYGEQASNLEGDQEVYVMRALDGTGKRNLSNNGIEVAGAYPVDDLFPEFSPGGKKIAYMSEGEQASNPEGDTEVYRMNTLDGTGKKNLSDNGDGINDVVPFFSPDGQKVFYESYGEQNSNPEGDREIYRMNTLDGTSKKNLTHNGLGVQDYIYPE